MGHLFRRQSTLLMLVLHYIFFRATGTLNNEKWRGGVTLSPVVPPPLGTDKGYTEYFHRAGFLKASSWTSKRNHILFFTNF